MFTEWGTIDFDPERVKEIENASNITYDEYLEIMRSSGRNVRHDFEQCFYESFGADFKGRVEKKTNGRICFRRI